MALKLRNLSIQLSYKRRTGYFWALKMKSILIMSVFLPPIAGGSERVALSSAIRLSEKYEVHILTMKKHHLKFEDKNITFHYLPYYKPLSLYCLTLGRVRLNSLNKKHRFDICHAHIPLPLALTLPDFKGKTIITCHGGEYEFYGFSGFFNKQLCKHVLQRANVVTAPSRWFCDIITKEYKVNTVFLPNGIDIEKIIPQQVSSLPTFKFPNPYFLFYGRYIERKGIRYLLEAAKRLPMYHFVFAGAGPLNDEITGANIMNIGYQNMDSLIPFIQGAVACIFPSIWENLPLVGLEAMSLGKVVIATEIGFSEYIENMKDGIVIKPKSVDGIINAVKLVGSDSGLRSFIEGNARKKAERYSWENVIKEYFVLYERVLSGEIGK
jgi:glycosyltransferase involved in cell wall biosynthesis